MVTETIMVWSKHLALLKEAVTITSTQPKQTPLFHHLQAACFASLYNLNTKHISMKHSHSI